MDFKRHITVNLVSFFRWQSSCHKNRPENLLPDMVVKINTVDTVSPNGMFGLEMSLDHVDFLSELADNVDLDIGQKIAEAVLKRCKKDFKVVQMFGAMLRGKGNTRTGVYGSGNMFSSTDFKVNMDKPYTFVVALEGTGDQIDGVYLVPSTVPAPEDSYDTEPFYKMSCFERI